MKDNALLYIKNTNRRPILLRIEYLSHCISINYYIFQNNTIYVIFRILVYYQICYLKLCELVTNNYYLIILPRDRVNAARVVWRSGQVSS